MWYSTCVFENLVIQGVVEMECMDHKVDVYIYICVPITK